MKSGTLNLLEPSGPVQACNGIALPLPFLLHERLKKITENLLGEYQCGFRKNRSTSDQIFTIRQIMEKHYEHNQDLHMLFVDFKQAFDSIDRHKLYQAMDDMS
jgi:hypothetical protein